MSKKAKFERRSPKITAGTPFAWIEEMFKDYKRPEAAKWPFDFLVGVAGRIDSPGPRDERYEYILDAGMPLIEKVLICQPIGKGPHFFIFPDRWMVPAEAVEFGHRLACNPDAKSFGRVYVITHQPYIVQDCLKEQVRIMYKKKL